MWEIKSSLSLTYPLLLALSWVFIFVIMTDSPTHARGAGTGAGDGVSEGVSVSASGSGSGERFRFTHEVVSEDGTSKFRLWKSDGNIASYSDALQLLESDASFRVALTSVLREQQTVMPAYFWECSPFTANTIDIIPFEFVTLPATVLLTRRPDKKSFEEKFRQGSESDAVAFPSLGGDAMLIAPVPHEGIADEAYMHLATFVQRAEEHQVDALWQTVAHTIRKQLDTSSSSRKIWLSTSGAGVQWLHVRLDSRPKYYNWREYM
jgi:hypothetical protein